VRSRCRKPSYTHSKLLSRLADIRELEELKALLAGSFGVPPRTSTATSKSFKKARHSSRPDEYLLESDVEEVLLDCAGYSEETDKGEYGAPSSEHENGGGAVDEQEGEEDAESRLLGGGPGGDDDGRGGVERGKDFGDVEHS
jgi:hypothetical protein